MTGDDRVLPATRLLSAAIVPFLLVAFVVLFGFPNDTKHLFAWTIEPSMTPMLLGGVYLGGAYFFVRAARGAAWHTVKAGFPSVAAFASLMGVATVLHWDRFNHRHVAFWMWAGLYFTTPFLVTGVWLANRRTERAATADDLRLGPVVRYVIGGLGVMAVGFGLFLFILPSRAIAIWPWTLTPLTARVVGAVLMLGLGAIVISLDGRWSAARLMLQVQSVMMALILVAAARAHRQFDTSNPMTWLLAAGFLGALIGALATLVTLDRAGRAPTVAAT